MNVAGPLAVTCRLLGALLLGATSCISAPNAQPAHPMPAELVAQFSAMGTFADTMDLPADEGDLLRVKLGFRNKDTEGSVSAVFEFRDGSAAPGVLKKEWSLGFKPTALCRKGGLSNQFFVVGWSERSGQVVVEEWTFSPYALTTAPPLSGESGDSVLTVEEPRREHLVTLTSLEPVVSAVHNPYGGKLFLLAQSTPRSIRVLDVATGTLEPAPVASAATWPALESHRSLHGSRMTTGAFLIYTEERPRWASPTQYQLPYPVLELVDSDSDGDVDTVKSVEFGAFIAAWTGAWVRAYP